ncbi:SH3 domain-binding glutamic acid-rich-like protein 2 isoform X1 [Apteryx mantelli]|uniref:SH3 domain-binding glutamic acid-rich-like protein 2 isoform X1 n=2 Tax=Apteryx mantelli TaxID=2696672 RepID=A0ABM4EBV6_9AVES
MVIRVFVASSSGSVALYWCDYLPSPAVKRIGELSYLRNKASTRFCKIKKRQQDVVRFLEANRIEFEEVDITMSEEKRQWMYKNIPEDRQPAQGNPLPPQIFSDDRYCGDYDGFFESKESNTVFSFLGLKPSLTSKESEP